MGLQTYRNGFFDFMANHCIFEDLLQGRQQVLGHGRTHVAPNDFTFIENNAGGVPAARQSFVMETTGVGVQTQEFDLAFEEISNLIEGGLKDTAGAAGVTVELKKDQLVWLCDFFGKGWIIDFFEKGSFTHLKFLYLFTVMNH